MFKFPYHHEGVVELFDAASKNGYVIIYLSAIPLAADGMTRNYLFDQLQNLDGYSIPISPVIMSPLVWHTVIWEDYKERMKLSALKFLFDMFDLKHDVAVGAYGNKETDTQAYLKAGIRNNTVYFVNKESKMINVGTKEETSYEDHCEKVNQMYPRY